MNKPSEAKKYFEELMRSRRSLSDTSRIGYIKHFLSTKGGESSKNGEQRYAKSKGNPTCHHCGKLGYIPNNYRSKNGKKTYKPKFFGNCFNLKKVGHQAHQCRSNKSNSPTTSRFEGHCYNCQKYLDIKERNTYT